MLTKRRTMQLLLLTVGAVAVTGPSRWHLLPKAVTSTQGTRQTTDR